MNYSRIKLLFIFLIACFHCSTAQILQKGELRLINTENIPIGQAIVQVSLSNTTNPIFIGITDDKGVLLVDSIDKDSLFFSISHISYGNVHRIIYQNEWISNKCTIQLAENSLTLPEIAVKGKDQGIRVLGDTIRFDLRVLASGNEKDLNQLLKRLPGMEISNTGEIRYNGKTVNKILLGGKDIIRSQFELANSLILPNSLSAIEIINDAKSKISNDTPQYLNLVLKKDQSYLSSNSIKYAAPNNRGEADASILSTGNRDLGYYALVRFSSTDKPAITSADFIRSNDFDIQSLIAQNENDSNFESLSLNNFTLNSKKDLIFQLNAQLKKKKAEISLFGQYRNLNSSGFQSTFRKEIITNTTIESAEKREINASQLLDINMKGVFDISKKISSIVYIQTNSNHYKSSGVGTSIFDGQSTPFETTIEPQSVTFTALQKTKYKLDSIWSFNFYTKYNQRKIDHGYSLTDGYPIYDIGLPNNDAYNLIGNIKRTPRRLNTNGVLIRKVRSFELGLGYQARFTSFTENGYLQGVKSDTDFTKTNSFNESQHLYSFQMRSKTPLGRLKTKVGFSQNTYTNNNKTERVAPYVSLRLTGKLNRFLNFSLDFDVQTNIIDLDKFWANGIPINNRNYTINRHNLIYSKGYSASSSLRYINPVSATNFLFRANYSFFDKSVVLNQQNLEAFQVQFGTAVPNVQNINALTYYSKKIDVHRISCIQNISWSQQSLITNNEINAINRLHWSVQFRVSSEWTKWLNINLEAKADHTRQAIASITNSFTSIKPQITSLFLLSNKINIVLSSSFDQVDDIKIRPILSGELSLKSNNKKLRYTIGVFNALNLSSYTYRHATIESSEILFRNVTNMPGSIKVGMEYRPFE